MKPVIQDKIEQAIRQLQDSGAWTNVPMPDFEIDYPQHRNHGDYASNVAMKLAKVLRRNPLDIGEELKAQIMQQGMDGLDRVEVEAPGFLNFFINQEFLGGGIRYILKQGQDYGHNATGLREDGTPKKYLVEFLSANPTGPLHLGNGRGGFTGDVIVRILQACRYEVIAEYIINDYGNQVDTLTESVLRRYLQQQGIKIDYGDDLYQGEYINDLAKQLKLDDVPLGQPDAMKKIREEVKDWALQQMITQIQDLAESKFGIHYDVWMSEKSLHSKNNVARAQDFLREHDLMYEQDGAIYFRSAQYGDEKDRVLIKSDGSSTYFYSDILYLIDKFVDRKIDHWVWVLGADHHGYKGRMEAALEAIGHKGKMDIIFAQLVRLIFNGKELRMSKRKGTFVTLEELVDEIGLDVARWFFVMHDVNTHMDFDLNLAREESDKNPVYYVQYAHARICSILKKIKTAPMEEKVQLTNAAEETLAKILFKLPELVEEISHSYAIHKLPQYALEVARAFHKFYATSQVIEDDTVNSSRYQLVKASQIVLANTLALMGIQAPEKM